MWRRSEEDDSDIKSYSQPMPNRNESKRLALTKIYESIQLMLLKIKIKINLPCIESDTEIGHSTST